MSDYGLLDVAKDLVRGNLQFVLPHIRDARSKVCLECPSLQKIPMTRLGTCKECGCFMDAKTQLSKAVCPLRKWEK